jgi:PAS domain S-box-containing protein
VLSQGRSSAPTPVQARQESKSGQAKISKFFDAIPAPVVCIDRGQRIVLSNQAATRMFGYQPKEFLERKLTDLLAPTSLGAQTLSFESNSELSLDELGWRHQSGSIFHAKSRHRSLAGDQQGQVWMWIECCRDDTQMMESVRVLAEQREAERLRLARDLHDGAIQELLGVGFSLTEIRRQVQALDIELPGRPIASLQIDIIRITRMLRSLVSELRPAGLEEFGLRDTLEGYVAKVLRDLAGKQPEVHLEIQNLSALTPPQELCLFRTAQEALRNTIQHAQAAHVYISLMRLGSEALLLIKDDGCGFEVAAHLVDLTRSRHFGLAGMIERVQLVHGHLCVHSSLGNGTEIRVTLALED